ncbi:hypothetical protein EIP91_011970 [Steccherinum ochraceum]|uniref:Uncharacterized protein n=1 Tax=Steccherinum ochraceum TaxID=92696 RepID=A0A4R0RXM8_9APHY|nr:hypothetical protein EIP91_011970 [Steccherinum ochraceum]
MLHFLIDHDVALAVIMPYSGEDMDSDDVVPTSDKEEQEIARVGKTDLELYEYLSNAAAEMQQNCTRMQGLIRRLDNAKQGQNSGRSTSREVSVQGDGSRPAKRTKLDAPFDYVTASGLPLPQDITLRLAREGRPVRPSIDAAGNVGQPAGAGSSRSIAINVGTSESLDNLVSEDLSLHSERIEGAPSTPSRFNRISARSTTPTTTPAKRKVSRLYSASSSPVAGPAMRGLEMPLESPTAPSMQVDGGNPRSPSLQSNGANARLALTQPSFELHAESDALAVEPLGIIAPGSQPYASPDNMAGDLALTGHADGLVVPQVPPSTPDLIPQEDQNHINPEPLLLFTPQSTSRVLLPPLAGSPRLAPATPMRPEIANSSPKETPSSPLTPFQSPEPPAQQLSHPPQSAQQPLEEQNLNLIQDSRRYPLRKRQPQQEHPYRYDQLYYHHQMQHNPKAIVRNPTSPHGRRGSLKRREVEGSGSDAEVEQDGEEDDAEENRFWKKYGKHSETERGRKEIEGRGNGKKTHQREQPDTLQTESSSMPRLPTAARPAILDEVIEDSSEDEDPVILAARRRQEQAKKSRPKRVKQFPMAGPPLGEEHQELLARYGDQLSSDDDGDARRRGAPLVDVFRMSEEPPPPPAKRDVEVISISSSHSRGASPMALDFGTDLDLPPPDSELDGPPTSSMPDTNRSRSAGASSHPDDNDEASSSDRPSKEKVTEAERRRRKEDRRRQKALSHMLPKSYINKITKKGSETQANKSRMRRATESGSESNEDQPLRPGQTRVRKGLHRTTSEIRGDSESDVETPADFAGYPGDEGHSARSLSPDRRTGTASETGRSHRGHVHRRSATVISISSSEAESSEDSGAPDDDEEIERWVSAPVARRSSKYDDVIREGDLIDRMLSRTRISRKKKASSGRQRDTGRTAGRAGGAGGTSVGHTKGGRGAGSSKLHVVTHGATAGHQTRLPFKRQPSTSSRASGSHFHGGGLTFSDDERDDDLAGYHGVDDQVMSGQPIEHQIEDSHAARKVLKPKDKKRLEKAVGVWTFAPSGKQLPLDHTRPAAVSLEAGEVVIQRSILEFARKDDIAQPAEKSKSKKHRTERHRDSPLVDDGVASDLQHFQDLGKQMLPSGLMFGRGTYLNEGWLQDFLSTQNVTAPDAPQRSQPGALAVLDFFIPAAPSIVEFTRLTNQVLDKLFRLIQTEAPQLSCADLQDWRRLLRCVCTHVSWFLANSPEDTEPLDQFAISLASHLLRASDVIGAGFAVRADESLMNILVFDIQWFTVELAYRCKEHKLMVGDYTRPDHHVERLLKHLWAYGLARPLDCVSHNVADGFNYSTLSLRVAEIWICLIHVLQPTVDPSAPTFWSTLTKIIKDPLIKGPPAPDLRASEDLWVGIFGLVALSQFRHRGVSFNGSNLPSCWELVLEALRYFRFDLPEQGVPKPVLKKFNRRTRVMFKRCMLLRKVWDWRLEESTAVVSLIRFLQDVFKARQFSNFPSERCEFPSWLRNHDLGLLSDIAHGDTTYTLFQKLIVQTVRDTQQGEHLSEAYITKILSMTVPVGTLVYSKTSKPTDIELSKVYNRFSALAIAIQLEPSKTGVESHISTARRNIKYSEAPLSVRQACIRGFQYLGILFKYLDLPMKVLLVWLGDMVSDALDEYSKLPTTQTAETRTRKNGCTIVLQMALTSVASVIKTDMTRSEETAQTSQYPDPVFLEGPWITRLFTDKGFTAELSSGNVLLNFVEVFLHARRAIVPLPQRARVAVDSEESQELYGQFDDFNFDDPEVMAAMNDAEASSRTTLQQNEEVVCELMLNHIAPTMFRLFCGRLEAANVHISMKEWREDIHRWLQCWVECANLLVQNGKKVWSNFLQYGNQSWERCNIRDPPRRRYITTCFMLKVLQHDPKTYDTEDLQDRYMKVLLQSFVVAKPTLEHDYAALVFSTDDLRHRILEGLPSLERENPLEDYKISVNHFLAARVAWIQHICARISEALDAAHWDAPLSNQTKIWVGYVEAMLLGMREVYKELDTAPTEGPNYPAFCREVAQALTELPTLSGQKTLQPHFEWLRTVV